MFIRKLATKFFISTIFVLLFSQCTQGFALREAENLKDDEIKDVVVTYVTIFSKWLAAKTMSGADENTFTMKELIIAQDNYGSDPSKFWNETRKELIAYCDEYLHSLEDIFIHVTGDVEVNEEHLNQENLRILIKPLSAYITKLKLLEDNNDDDAKLHLVIDIQETLDNYDITKRNAPSDEDLFIAKSLNKNGIQFPIDKSAIPFLKRLKKKAPEIWQNSNAMDRTVVFTSYNLNKLEKALDEIIAVL